MKLNNITDVQKFLAAVNACQNDVYLKSQEGDVFNLKSSLSQYIAVGRLIEESGDDLELFAQTREDEVLLMNMLFDLSK
ncbi:MAG: polya polymerase [Oscillospiraceae bacterium]|nr:polya polymerase [Oscillospiraceae bacterium]